MLEFAFSYSKLFGGQSAGSRPDRRSCGWNAVEYAVGWLNISESGLCNHGEFLQDVQVRIVDGRGDGQRLGIERDCVATDSGERVGSDDSPVAQVDEKTVSA